MHTALFICPICPICHTPLLPSAKTWQCDGILDDQGNRKPHSFDVAKQGYINLLPVQFKKSKNPGDSEASILARQRFLQQDYYQPLAAGLIEFAKRQLALDKPLFWLDVGCGEGYYTEQFYQLNLAHLVAMDISKAAVQTTAKRLKNNANVTCLVATASQLPLAAGSVDVLSSIFSPILPDEFARVLADNGAVLIAKPLPHHLIQLRQGLFDIVQDHDSDKFIDQMADRFTLHAQHEIITNITVASEALADLMTMTPYAYRASPTKREAVIVQCQHEGDMDLTIAFSLYWFIKK